MCEKGWNLFWWKSQEDDNFLFFECQVNFWEFSHFFCAPSNGWGCQCTGEIIKKVPIFYEVHGFGLKMRIYRICSGSDLSSFPPLWSPWFHVISTQYLHSLPRHPSHSTPKYFAQFPNLSRINQNLLTVCSLQTNYNIALKRHQLSGLCGKSQWKSSERDKNISCSARNIRLKPNVQLTNNHFPIVNNNFTWTNHCYWMWIHCPK